MANVCSMCGGELQNEFAILRIENHERISESFGDIGIWTDQRESKDLCFSCRDKVLAYIKTGKAEEVRQKEVEETETLLRNISNDLREVLQELRNR